MGNAPLFKKGYEAVKEEKQRQDERQENLGKQLWRFFLAKDGDEAVLRFLTEAPLTFFEHTLKNVRGGKESYDSKICTQDEHTCPYCAAGDRPQFKGAFLVWDGRPYSYTNNKGEKKEGVGQLRLFVQGARVLSMLDRISGKYGLSNRDVTMVRSGKGTSTTYIIEKGDERRLTQQEITNMLPEKLRESYNGTMDSLYAIVEEQLVMSMNAGGNSESSSYEEDEGQERVDYNKNVIGIQEEDYQPVTIKKPPMFKKKSPTENSVKSLFSKNKANGDDIPF